jgi:predicted transcriptional regulator
LGFRKKLTYRSKQELFASILQSVERSKKDAKITRIIYESRSSHKSVSRNIHELVELGLLKCGDGNKIFRITDKGHEFLHVFDEMNSMVVQGLEI